MRVSILNDLLGLLLGQTGKMADLGELDDNQLAFLMRLRNKGTATIMGSEGLSVGDLLYRGIIEPIEPNSWTFCASERAWNAIQALEEYHGS